MDQCLLKYLDYESRFRLQRSISSPFPPRVSKLVGSVKFIDVKKWILVHIICVQVLLLLLAFSCGMPRTEKSLSLIGHISAFHI